jgi:hypothetical protein
VSEDQVREDLRRFNQGGRKTWPGHRFEAYRIEEFIVEGT